MKRPRQTVVPRASQGPRRALVTGGSGTIGAAIARQVASLGFDVLVHGFRHVDRAESVASQIRADGGRADAIEFDVTDFQACRQVLEPQVESSAIQVIIHNAGLHADGPLAGMTPESWNTVVDVALKGFFNITQPLLLPMIRTRWGRIISITSVSGLLGNRGQVNYAAAKAGLHGATKALALELASRGITVNAIAPGMIATSDTLETFDAESVDRLVPMRRMGTPEEVAGAVAYLLSEQAGYVSGQILSVNGGMA